MPEAAHISTTSPSPSRRAVLRGAAAAAALPAAAAAALPAPPHPDAALLDLCARIVANDAEAHRLWELECAATGEGRDEEARVLSDRGGALTRPYHAMVEELIHLPARTQAGLRAKAEVLARQADTDLDGAPPLGDRGVAWSVARDALRLLVPA